MGFVVRDFFINGGEQAVIVRVHNQAKPATFHIPTGKKDQVLKLQAADPGAWGNNLRVQIVRIPGDDTVFDLAADELQLGLQLITHGERFLGVSVTPGQPRFLPTVLENESRLVKLVTAQALPAVRPPSGTTMATPRSGTDGKALTKSQILKGITTLDQCDLFNILCIPPYRTDGNVDLTVIKAAASYCEKRRAFFIVDSPTAWIDTATAKTGIGTTSANAAIYFPRLMQHNPLKNGQVEMFSSCGAVAGIFARTDANRGVWKAPAGNDATISGINGLSLSISDAQNGELNPLGINCLRSFPNIGAVVWGSRTLAGVGAFDWKYIPVRRTALFIEESLYRGTQWAAFELNDEALWAEIRLQVGAFMQDLFLRGAFQGQTPRDAYFVKCDTTTQADLELGVVNILVGYAPLKPAEFIVLTIQQMTGQV